MEEKKTILIVDDESDSVEFVKAIISEIGDFSVISASDGKSGLEKAKSELPDLIILDVMMPEKDGFSVFYDLKRNPDTENIPVIMLTGVSKKTGIKFSGEAMGEYLGREPVAFIDKPVDPAKLQKAVRKVLGI